MRKDTAIHCRTQEDWDYITKKYNISWGTSDGWKTINGWWKHKEHSIIFAFDKTFADLDYAKRQGYRIITTKQFKKGEKTMSNKVKTEVKGLEVELDFKKNTFEVIGKVEFEPKHDEEFYYIDSDGTVENDMFSQNSGLDEDKLKIGNCFATKEEAEEMLKSFLKILKK